jgi:hypothetical protein
LYDSNRNREHLIEFKALNPTPDSYSKDFLKLICDEDNDKITNYFIQVIENSDPATIPNIECKYRAAVKNAQAQAQAQIPSLKQSHLVIFLYVMQTKEFIKYEVDWNGQVITKYIWKNGNGKGNWIKVATIPIPPKN